MFKIPPLSSDIFAISLDAKSSPSINITLPNQIDGSHSLGWGFGWYPEDHAFAMVIKDPSARGEQVLINAITDWSIFRSTVFFSKVRGASTGYIHTDTQPFSRSYAGRDWVFMHNGDLDKSALLNQFGVPKPFFEPLGSTDSEYIFCDLLAKFYSKNARSISDVDEESLHTWFTEYDQYGSADMCISDGDTIVCFHGSHSPKKMYYTRIQPPNNQGIYSAVSAQVSLHDPRDTYRTALIVSSCPFDNIDCVEMHANQLLVVRRGSIIWDSSKVHTDIYLKKTGTSFNIDGKTQNEQQKKTLITQADQVQQAQSSQITSLLNSNLVNIQTTSNLVTKSDHQKELKYRLFKVMHNTHYSYAKPVERSTHGFRLKPVDDTFQRVLNHQLSISSIGEEINYEDVFGNQAVYFSIQKPYTELTVSSTNLIKVYESLPDDYSLSQRQNSIPLIWMPWQRQMMMPYLLPPELPESQLNELTDYAMSFASRNDLHLLQTIEDMNISIYRDYKYVSGSTSLNTTPFEVYISRQGVCQDFANLLICMARLLGIPARYRMGYIFTGVDYANKIQSDASHAWTEVYLPYVGWRGFDPTNGCSISLDHIRVACGRNYRDATPTSGTIYKGGGIESLTVDVKMHEIFE